MPVRRPPMNATATPGRVGEFRSIVLENRQLRAVIIPELGARVWTLEDRIRHRQWIWHRDDVPLARVPFGSSYDDVWAGGWEELFPNDAPARHDGRDLPDHGEWWTRAWNVDEHRSGETAVLRLSTGMAAVRTACTKEFRLRGDAASLSVHYRIRSLESRPVHFLFKQHLPVRITPGCRLALPGGTAQAVDPAFGTLAGTAEPFAWPRAPARSAETDLSLVPERGRDAREFLYVSELPEGWCGVDDPGAGASLRMHYDGQRMPYVWLFLTYGGWRNLYTAVIEPCTNMPKDLAEAVRLGQSARLEPGKEFTTSVTVTLGGLAT